MCRFVFEGVAPKVMRPEAELLEREERRKTVSIRISEESGNDTDY